jgi:pimeloyl-ACP methyl ester carboxylesterase
MTEPEQLVLDLGRCARARAPGPDELVPRLQPAPRRRRARATPGCRHEVIDGAGHFLQLERPDVVNALMRDFLEAG